MCVQELILNIIELESVSKEKTDPKLLQELIRNCPIELQIPGLLYENQYESNERQSISQQKLEPDEKSLYHNSRLFQQDGRPSGENRDAKSARIGRLDERQVEA